MSDRIEADSPNDGGVDSTTEKVDLTQLKEFREWQANSDRRYEELRRKFDAVTRDQEREQRRARELDELGERTGQEVVSYFHDREDRAAEDVQERNNVQGKAKALLDTYGIAPDDPGLNWGDGPTPSGLAALAESVLKIVAERGKQEATVNAREAEIKALKGAGITKTSTVLGPPPADDNPIEDINDSSELYRMAFKKGQ